MIDSTPDVLTMGCFFGCMSADPRQLPVSHAGRGSQVHGRLLEANREYEARSAAQGIRRVAHPSLTRLSVILSTCSPTGGCGVVPGHAGGHDVRQLADRGASIRQVPHREVRFWCLAVQRSQVRGQEQ